VKFVIWGIVMPRSFHLPARIVKSSFQGTGLAAFMLLAACSQVTQTNSHMIEFNGELDYATFERAAAQGRGVRVKSSPGGTGAAATALAKVDDVIIDGDCDSACAWAFIESKTACFTDDASFGFHAAYDPASNRMLPGATSYWLAKGRANLRARIEAIKSPDSIVRIEAAEMKRYYPERACSATRLARSASGSG
jgi:hypothetical protein